VIISLDAALTLQSASQTVNNLTAKLKYVDTVMKEDNLWVITWLTNLTWIIHNVNLTWIIHNVRSSMHDRNE